MTFGPQEPLYLQESQTTSAAIKNRLLINSAVLGGLDTSEGSFEDDVLASVSIELSQAAILPQNLYRRVFIDTATGSDLDAQADQTGIAPRLPAVAASGIVQFNAPAGTVIPINTRVGTSTAPARTATTDTAVTVAVGATNVGVSAHDTVPGTAGNMPIGAYTRLIDSVSGVTSVSSTTTFSGGSDPESDTQLRARIKQARQEPGASANRAEVRTISLGVPGVGGVEVLYTGSGTPPVPLGEIRVTLIDSTGIPASKALVETVRDTLSEPARVTVEAETMTLSAGAVLDGTQTGAVGTTVELPPSTSAHIVEARIDLILPQGGPYELWPRVKRGASVGAGNLFQIGVWDVTAAAWAKQSALSSSDAVYMLSNTGFPTGFDSIYVGDFFANLLDQLELRITRQTADATTAIWLDEVLYRSAMQRVDIDQTLPGFFRLRVQPAINVPIDVVVTLTYTAGLDPAAVRAAIREAIAGAPNSTSLGGYLTTIPFGTGLNQVVQVGAIGDAIFRTSGVASYDFSTLTVNTAQSNITITPEQRATLRDLTINGVAA